MFDGGGASSVAPAASAAPAAPSRVLFQVGRHQLVAVLATACDFGLMVALVSGAGLSPVAATPLGALAGAVVSFTLGRHWIFQAAAGHPGAQALRYALVSAVSLGLNTGGEALLYGALGLEYVVARALTALAVGLLWNYPLHRFWVFAVATHAAPRRGGSGTPR